MRPRAVLAGLIALAAGALLALRHRARSLAARPPLPSVPTAPVSPELPAAPRFLSVAWELAEPVEAGDHELTIRFTRAAQMALDRVDVQETPTQVFLTVIVLWEPPADGRFAWDEHEIAAVSLRHPLGTRELVHAATDAVDALYP